MDKDIMRMEASINKLQRQVDSLERRISVSTKKVCELDQRQLIHHAALFKLTDLVEHLYKEVLEKLK